MDNPLPNLYTSLTKGSDIRIAFSIMDPDDVSVTDSPIAETAEEDDYEKQVAALQSYLNSVPYECETIDEMRAKLEYIVGRILVCAEAKNWLVLSTWDGLLQWRVQTVRGYGRYLISSLSWLLMRYPMPKSTRAKLVRLYYELCLLPGIEARVVRNWADMLTRLLDNKPGSRRKLEVEDLELSWRPLWRALGKELWPKRRAQDASRNVVNILLYVAEHSRRYYPATEIPEMLETFLPLVTQDVRNSNIDLHPHVLKYESFAVRVDHDSGLDIVPSSIRNTPLFARPIQVLAGVQLFCH